MENKYQQSVYGKIPCDWRIDCLKNICVENDGILTGPFGSQLHQRDYQTEGIPIITVEHLGENYLIHSDIPRVSDSDYERLSRYKLEAGDIVFSRVGSVDRRALVRAEEAGWLFSGRCLRVRPNCKIVNPEFLSWFFGLPIFKDYIRKIAVGATMPSLNTTLLSNIKVIIPPLEEQDAIAKILSELTNLILLNHETNRTLEAVGGAVFKRWFVDFEFPNEEGKPYKSTGGKMVYNEDLNKEIPKGWQVKKLDEISLNFDSKRVPLSNREREKMKGNYPYYGAAGILDYVDDFIFDGTFALMGEDGTVIDEKGFPILQLVRGKFWANNHAHVLQGKGISTELLFMLLKNTNVQHIVTGAVQPKINQGNMNSLKFVIPDNPCKNRLQNFINQLYAKIGANDEQSKTLTQIRDLLLPKLMSGKIRVPFNKEKL